MSSFAEAVKSGKYLVTAELTPPKGTDLTDLLRRADLLKPLVNAVNLTDSAGAIMTMAPIAVAKALADRGLEPILQITSRDRNRIAVQGDMLAAYALGVKTLVCMGGDSPSAGDHPEAKAVFDLDTMALLNAVQALNAGHDLSGAELKGNTDFLLGAVCNPGADDLEKEVSRMKEKIDAGATFFQTQAVYDRAMMERFIEKAHVFNVPIIGGFIVLKSGDMARRLNRSLPGLEIPDDLIEEMDKGEDRVATSIEMAGRIIGEMKAMTQGVHIMAIGWETRIPAILERAGVHKAA